MMDPDIFCTSASSGGGKPRALMLRASYKSRKTQRSVIMGDRKEKGFPGGMLKLGRTCTEKVYLQNVLDRVSVELAGRCMEEAARELEGTAPASHVILSHVEMDGERSSHHQVWLQ